MVVRFGVVLPQGFKRDLDGLDNPVGHYAAMARVAREAERLGYHAAWLSDHLLPEPRPGGAHADDGAAPVLECWTGLAALARDTATIRLGALVTNVTLRNPALLANMAATVDAASGGRLDLGLGAGWYEAEARAYGYPFPGAAERVARLGEALGVIQACWAERPTAFAGRYYRVDAVPSRPRGVQRPHIPLWIGGGGERGTLRLVARHADACNLIAHDPAIVARKLAVLREHCARTGRDYAAIRKSVHAFVILLAPGEDLDAATRGRGNVSLDAVRRSNLAGTPAEVAMQLRVLVAAGADSFILYFRTGLADGSALRRFAAEVLPRVEAAGGAA
jgi:F420-dependent oxidoreductase-like protein